MLLCHCVGALSINAHQLNANTTKLITKWSAFYTHTGNILEAERFDLTAVIKHRLRKM